MRGKKITTIVFDIGGVLLDIHPERTYQYISDSTDINIDVVKNTFPWDSHENSSGNSPRNYPWEFPWGIPTGISIGIPI